MCINGIVSPIHVTKSKTETSSELILRHPCKSTAHSLTCAVGFFRANHFPVLFC